MKLWVKIAIGVAAVLILAVLSIPLFVNADSFRPMLESKLSSAAGRKVTLGKLSFSLFTRTITADDLTVADDPAFSSAPFLQAKSLRIDVHTRAFLLHHQISVKRFVAESPQIQLISNDKGIWNYASLGRGAPGTDQAGHGPDTDIFVGSAQIENGRIAVSSLPATGQPFVYDAVNISVDNLSFGHVMPFSLTANLPGNGSVALSGTAGPWDEQDASATPESAQLTVRNFDPVKSGVVPASAGIGMEAEIEAQLKSDGKTAKSTGTIVAERLVLVKGGSPAPNPVNLTYTVTDDLKGRTGQLNDLAMATGPVTVHAAGTFATKNPATTVDLQVNVPRVPVDAVEALLPAVGVHLPSGSQLKGGTLTAQMAITGTTAAPVIAGPVEVDDTNLAGFDLASKIQGLKALTGTGGGTGIQVLHADVRETSVETQLTNINCVIPAIGTATGEGTVAESGAMNFQLKAKLSGTGAAGAAVDAAAGALGGVAGSLLHTAANATVPITITGTSSNPVIRANVGAMARGAVTKKGLGGVLGGLLGPK